jgi:glycosyltransferase involved in cell wall biosynthesis
MMVSIVIVTRNRAQLLDRAVQSCLEQDYKEIEILVFDDSSDDDTGEKLLGLPEKVRYFRASEPKGYIIHRNTGFQEALGEVVVSLDDDAFFTSPSTVSELVSAFHGSPDTVAFGLRYTEPASSPRNTMTKVAHLGQLRCFIGCAHAIRRSSAIAVGSYDERLVHQGEERDLCIRLLEQGGDIRYLHTPPILHERAPRLDEAAVDYLGIRNTLYFDMRRTPLLLLLPCLPWDIVRLFFYKLKTVGPLQRGRDLMRSIKYCLSRLRDREVVSIAGYVRFRSLPRHGAEYLPSVIEAHSDV